MKFCTVTQGRAGTKDDKKKKAFRTIVKWFIIYTPISKFYFMAKCNIIPTPWKHSNMHVKTGGLKRPL